MAELPINSTITLSIWGRFDTLFPEVEVRSSEGQADVHSAAVVYGWPLSIAGNAWWFIVLVFLIVGLGLLRYYERQKATQC